MEPVSAVANAVGEIFQFGSNLLAPRRDRLLAVWQSVGNYNWYFNSDKEKDYTGIITIAILGVVLLGLVIAVALRKK